MVGVGPSPYSESLIRWMRRASGRHGCPWLAVWVDGTRPLTAQEQDLLARGLGLARRLGAEVVHATGADVAATLLQVARERNVSQIIVGKANRPVIGRPSNRPEPRWRAFATDHPYQDYGVALAIIVVLTVICWTLEPVVGYTVPALADVVHGRTQRAGVRFHFHPTQVHLRGAGTSRHHPARNVFRCGTEHGAPN